MKGSLQKTTAGATIVAVVLSYFALGLIAFQHVRKNLPCSGHLPLTLALFVTAGLAIILLHHFSGKRLFREYAASGLLLVLFISGLYVNLPACSFLRSLEPSALGGPDSVASAVLKIQALNVSTGFWLVCAAGLLLSCPISRLHEKNRENILLRPARNLAIICATLTAAISASFAVLWILPGLKASAGLTLLAVSGLLLMLAGIFLVVCTDDNSESALFSLMFVSLSPLCLYTGIFLLMDPVPAFSPSHRPLPLFVSSLFSITAVIAAFVSAGRTLFGPVKTGRTHAVAAAAVVALAFILLLGHTAYTRRSAARSLESTGTLAAAGIAVTIFPFSFRENPWKLDHCIAGEEASGRSIPAAPQGYCPDVFADDPSALQIVEPPGTPLREIGRKIKPRLGGSIRTLAINVKNRSGRLRIIPLGLPVVRTTRGFNGCDVRKKIEFPWIPPVEESDFPLIFPLCSGAEIMSPEPGSCLRLTIALAPAASSASGGGCKSPNYYIPIDLALKDKGGAVIQFGAAGKPVELSRVDDIEGFLWKNLSIGKKMSHALVLLIDPQKAGTLQDLVDLIDALRWRSSPPVDRLWLKGWEITP